MKGMHPTVHVCIRTEEWQFARKQHGLCAGVHESALTGAWLVSLTGADLTLTARASQMHPLSL